MVEFQNEAVADYKADAMAIGSAFLAASVSYLLVYMVANIRVL